MQDKKPLCNVYLLPVPERVEYGELFPKERQTLVQSTKDDCLKRQRYAVWKALEYGLEHSLAKKLQDISPKLNENGQWTGEGVFFSLTHTKTMVAVAISNEEVGIDVELLSRAKDFSNPKLKEKILSPKEKINACSNEQALAIWTQKESALKWRGEKNFIPSQLTAKELPATSFCLFGEYVLSICGLQTAAAQFFLLRDAKAEKLTIESVKKI